MINQYKINLDDVQNNMNDLKKQEMLKQHPYKIWEAGDGRVKTYIYDESKSNKRRIVAKKTRNELEEYLMSEYEKYNQNNTEVGHLFKEWIAYALSEKDIEKNSADRYYNDYDKFIVNTEFASMDIRNVTSHDVISFLKDTINRDDKITRKAFSNLKTVLNGLFSYAKSERKLECISMTYTLKDFKVSDKKFKKNIVKDAQQVFNEDEAIKIANFIIANYKTIRELGVLFSLLTGLRVGELCTLKYSDCEQDILYIQRTEVKYKNTDGKTIYDVREFPKTECSMNGIELSNSAIDVFGLIKRINMSKGIKSDYVFFDEEYGRLKSYFFNKELKKICNNLNIPFRSMHKLRKTYASYLLANGVDEKIAQAQLRHKDSTTTHKYYEFSVRNKNYIRGVINENDLLSKVNIL